MEIVPAGKGSVRELLASEREAEPEPGFKPNDSSRKLMKALYKALAVETDLEWWYRGPPHCQHMMRILTGESRHVDQFKFRPRSIAAFGDRVMAEGWRGSISEAYFFFLVKD